MVHLPGTNRVRGRESHTYKVMEAWREGIRGMKTGGKRRLLVPSKLGYGEKGVADIVPPNADLVFDVELLEVR